MHGANDGTTVRLPASVPLVAQAARILAQIFARPQEFCLAEFDRDRVLHFVRQGRRYSLVADSVRGLFILSFAFA
jgi:hypothetical protein